MAQLLEVKLFMMRQLLQSQRISVIYINYLVFCNLDFKVNNGEYYFIELNVRFAGSGIFSIIASFNYIETYLEHFVLNETLHDMDYYMKYVCWDSIVTRYLEELIYPYISE